MTNDKQRFACTAINKLSIELQKLADKNGEIHINVEELEYLTQILKRDIRGGGDN